MGVFSSRPQYPGNPEGLPPVPQEAVEQIWHLLPDKKVQAAKELRAATGLGLKEAKEVVDALALGQQVPVVPAEPPLSLAERARQLRGEGRPAAAIAMVSAETGMTEPEAARFLESLD